MKRKAPEGQIPPDTGPFRKMEHPNDGENLPYDEALAVKKMTEEIAAEGKFSIRLPENIKHGETVPFFEDAIKKNIDPKDVVFYSLATGIVGYDHVITHVDASSKPTQQKSFFYKSKNDPHIELKIWVEKNKATFANVTTKNDAEKIKKDEEKSDWRTANYELKHNIKTIKKIILTGVNQRLEKNYPTELSDLKNNVESLLLTINDELGKKK